MLLEEQKIPLFLEENKRATLREEVLKAAFRFPGLFDRSLYHAYEILVVNSDPLFLEKRTLWHVKRILCAQFFLQKKVENAQLKDAKSQKLFFLKLFKGPSCISIAFSHSSSNLFDKESILRAIDTLIPGISKIPGSFYHWRNPRKPICFTYFEVSRLRGGKEISTKHLKQIEQVIKEQMLASSPLTAAIFWPYNKEESHRQIQLLIREMNDTQDIPHASIHFQEQTSSSLEFLVHLVRPHQEEGLKFDRLPHSLYLFTYSHHTIHTPFSIDIDVFSIKMDAQLFDVRDSINLLYARRYLVKQLEKIIGYFRDFNGGLFEKQQDHFEVIRIHLASKIPYFDLFAEKVFYALHPFEKWLSLPIEDVQQLFEVFSNLIKNPNPSAALCTKSKRFTVVKTENQIDFLRRNAKKPHLVAHAQLTIGDFHYECFSGDVIEQIQSLLQVPLAEKHTLRLVFQEGSPPSLNPHYSSGDMRCRLLNKMLFEGLTRLDENGFAKLAGAEQVEISCDGLCYRFTLRKASWSNGEKVTAIDYADSWKWALEDNVCHPEVLFLIKNAKSYREKRCRFEKVGIQAVDPETLVVILEEKDPYFLEKLAQPFFFPLFGSNREPKWFNGPFIVQEATREGIRFSKNPYFWKEDEVYFESVEVKWIDKIEDIYTLFNQGKVDWIGDPLTILPVEQIRELERKNLLQKKPFKRRFSIYFNTHHPLLSSIPIRQSLSLAIDKTRICKEFFPYSIPSSSPYSEELAMAFFEQGLKELNLTRKTFPKLIFSYSDQTRRDEMASYFQKAWKKTLGIDVEIEKQSWNQFRSHLEKRRFVMCGTIQDTLNEGSLDFFKRFEGESSWNYSQWKHPTYRYLLDEAEKQSDPFKRKIFLDKARGSLKENVPFVPLFDYVHLYALRPGFSCPYFDSEGCVDLSQGKYL